MRRVTIAALAVALTAVLAPATAWAETPTPAPGAPDAAISTDTPVTIAAVPSVAAPGERVQVTASGWPANIPIQAQFCGNNALNGSADCDPAGSGTGQTDASGTAYLTLTVGTPPKPCPCVIYATSFSTLTEIRQPFEITGVPTATPTQETSTRSAEATLRITGGGGIAAWFGGSVDRTAILTVKNTGTQTLTNPRVTMTIGKSAEPSGTLANPQLGTIAPGQTIEYRLPITLGAPAFGQYYVRAQFGDLNAPLDVSANTSTYPWALIILAWLLLQFWLLGLYKKRPVATGPEDPMAAGLPTLNDPMPSGDLIGSSTDEDPFAGSFAPVGAGAGAALIGAGAATAVLERTAVVVPGEGARQANAMIVSAPEGFAPSTSPSLVPADYTPVFGVSELQGYLAPEAASTVTSQVNTRIIIGGIVEGVTPTDSQQGEA